MLGLPRSLIAVSVAMFILRVVWVFRFREIDSDAYGHYFIALAARDNPTNINVHWVWLPLFHFLVAPFTKIGLTFRGVRLVNALLAMTGPLLLYDATLRRSKSKTIALHAGIFYAVAPLTMILGQSAQPETLFITFVVLAVFFAARDRFVWAGVALSLACMVRYEAWGAALALCVGWALGKMIRRQKPCVPFWFAAIPAGVITTYVVFRYFTDNHQLLWFFRGTKDITKVQVARHAWTFREVISFPIVLPWYVFGPGVFFLLSGVRRAFCSWRDAILPIGFIAFLLLSYYGGAAHSGERYLISVVPFACVAMAFGVDRWAAVLKKSSVLVFAVAIACVALTTGYQLHRAAGMAIAWDEGLREREMELEKGR